MKDVYLKSNHSVKTISFKILISLIPLIITGFYKNGIKLYSLDLVNINGLLKPLIYTMTGFLIGIIVNIIYTYLIKKNKENFINNIFSSFHPVYGIIIASVISINTNYLLFITITFLLLFISKFFKETKFNIMSASALIIILIYNFLGNFTFLNLYESSRVLNLNTLDYLLGMGSGGINTTFVLFLLLSFLFLAKEDFYKKNIPLFSIMSFSLLIVFQSIYSSEVGLILEKIFTGGILFSFIFIAPDSLSSSYTNNGQIIFGIIIGTLTFGLYLIEPSLSALGAILITSLLHRLIDQLLQKKPN